MEVSDDEGDFHVEEWICTADKHGNQYLQQIGGKRCKCHISVKSRRIPDTCFESDRSSPPLHEVELTASDEDDDASVLELVIPVPSSRYKRVPTSSPKKMKRVAPALFCNLLCCVKPRKSKKPTKK